MVPCQLEPDPAVQPKQWLPVCILAEVSSSRDERSQTVDLADSGIASAWLKSQS